MVKMFLSIPIKNNLQVSTRLLNKEPLHLVLRPFKNNIVSSSVYVLCFTDIIW